MLKIILQRLGQGILVILALISITFLIVRLMPGDPFTDEKKLSEEAIQKNREFYQLDKPIPVQFGLYLKRVVLEGDLGPMMSNESRQVSEVIKQSFPVSLMLGLASISVAVCVGIPLGVFAALKQNSFLDYGTMAVAMIGICIPSFVVGPTLAILLGSYAGWFNVAGLEGPSDLVLPSITLGLATAAYLARLTRGGMLEVLNQDYVRTAHAKGVPMSQIIWRHTLKPGLLPSISFIGPAFAGLISGSFIVETIFQLPGMGQHFINAATSRDYNLLQGVVIYFGILIVFANFFVDLVQVALNPRLRNAS